MTNMLIAQQSIKIQTPGRGVIPITADISAIVSQSKIKTGICHLFLHHTSASLIICEHTDPVVLNDLESFMQRLVPDGDDLFEHVAEGPDDMPSHVRTILTQTFLSIPITQYELALGTWQGIFLWEHRLSAHQRKVTVTVQGSA